MPVTDFTPLGTTLCPSPGDTDARGATAKEHRQIKNALKRLRKKRATTRRKG